MSALWSSMLDAGLPEVAGIETPAGRVAYRSLHTLSLLPDLEVLRGRRVAIACREPLTASLAMMELDGLASRMLLCTPDLTTAQIGVAAAQASVEWLLCDEAMRVEGLPYVELAPQPRHATAARRDTHETEWVLMTSGTSGVPKLVRHSFESLAGGLPRRGATPETRVWSTFYDIRRYGGLQILLRAALLGAPLVLTGAHEAVADFLQRAGAAGVSHISGTPSHWRRALMSGEVAGFTPRYVRLSGETADQPVLDNLSRAFPHASVAHAFASTEAGLAFEVDDGHAGFPAAFLQGLGNGVDLREQDGTLRIRSPRTALKYLGAGVPLLRDAQGWIDTGDLIELTQDRYQFRGRRGGIINIGGLKVFPEEVEHVLNADPRVKLSRVAARRSPITGALVAAEVVLAPGSGNEDMQAQVKNELLERCRRALAPHKVPASLRFVDTLPVTAAGKLLRHDA